MKNRVNSLWTLFQERRLSRRTFMKSCVALTAILGLPPTMLDTVVKAAETTELPTVIWLHGHECTGCSESFIRSSSPFTSDVILNMISLEYDDTLAAASLFIRLDMSPPDFTRSYQSFPSVIPDCRASSLRVTHPFATHPEKQAPPSAFYLHVLGTPPAFVLSQDQTLIKIFNNCSSVNSLPSSDDLFL